jgi:hypothetical protein
MTRMPAGQLPRSSRPVMSATHAPSRTWPSPSQVGVHAPAGTISQALNQLDHQQQRLLDAYLAEIIALPETPAQT